MLSVELHGGMPTRCTEESQLPSKRGLNCYDYMVVLMRGRFLMREVPLYHTSLSMRTDAYVNYWIIAQETRQKSAIGRVTVRSAHRCPSKSVTGHTFSAPGFYSVRLGSLVRYKRPGSVPNASARPRGGRDHQKTKDITV